MEPHTPSRETTVSHRRRHKVGITLDQAHAMQERHEEGMVVARKSKNGMKQYESDGKTCSDRQT